MSNIDKLYVAQFQANLLLAAQQSTSKLKDCVMVETGVTGEQSSPVTFVNPLKAQKKTTRHTQLVPQNADYKRRWYVPVAFEMSDLVAWDDVLKASGPFDPKNALLKAFASGLSRAIDDQILASMFATAKVGALGSSSVSFPTSNVVSLDTGGVNSGLNCEKLKKAIQLLGDNGVDVLEEDIYCAITPRQNNELLRDIEIIGTEYRLQSEIMNGIVTKFMGINFRHIAFNNSEYFTDAVTALIDSSSNFRIPLWCKSGMSLGIWKEMVGKIDERIDLGYEIQVYASQMIGATRTDEKKVIEIKTYGN